MDKQYLKNVGFYIATAALSILIIAYIIYQLFNSYKSNIEIISVEKTTDNKTFTTDAYIMRSETILYADVEGNINYLRNNGEKVQANTPVADIYVKDELTATTDRNKIINIDKKIDILGSSNIGENIATMDTTSIDKKINELYNEIYFKVSNGDLNYVMYRKDELLTLLNKRDIITGSAKNYNDQILSLQNEKNALIVGDENVAETISNKQAGYFYSDIDGYENIFSSSIIGHLTVDDFNNLKNSEPQDLVNRNSSRYGVGKIITSYKWYIACNITKDKLRSFTVGNTYNVIFTYNNDYIIAMTLERIIQDPIKTDIVLVFSTGTLISDFNYLRKQSVEIVEASYTGYKIPISSVHITKDGRQGVFTMDGSTVVFKEILPLVEINGYFIVAEQNILNDDRYYDKLGLYDLVITKGIDIYDGKNVS